MKGEHKLAHQASEIKRLEEENRDLEMEIRALEAELRNKDALLKMAKAETDSIKESYEHYMFGYSEKIEALTEAQMKYESAAREISELIKKYKKEAESAISEIRKAV